MGKLQLSVIALLVLSFAAGSVFLLGKAHCEKQVLVKTITVTEVRNAIANNRPDDRVTINRLRENKF